MKKKSPTKKDEGLKALAAKNPNLEYKKEENYWDCVLWKTLDDVDDALDNVDTIEDMNWFKNRD